MSQDTFKSTVEGVETLDDDEEKQEEGCCDNNQLETNLRSDESARQDEIFLNFTEINVEERRSTARSQRA